MIRWARTGTIVAGLAWAGAALTPDAVASTSPSSAAGVREGEVVVVRSAGQPVRRLKVLSISSIPDGPTLVDVEDTDSASRYTIPLQALAKADREPSSGGTDVAAAPPPPPPVAPRPPARPVEMKTPTPGALKPGPKVNPVSWQTANAAPVPADYRQSVAISSPGGDYQTRYTPAAMAQAAPQPTMPAAPVAVTTAPPTPPAPTPPAPPAALAPAFQRSPVVAASAGGGWPRMTATSPQAWPQPTAWHSATPSLTPQTAVATPTRTPAPEHPLTVWNRHAPKSTEVKLVTLAANAESRPVSEEPIPLPSEIMRKLRFNPAPSLAQSPAPAPITRVVARTPEPTSITPAVAMSPLPPTSVVPRVAVRSPAPVSVSVAALAARSPSEPAAVRQASLSVPTRTDVWSGVPMDARMTAEVGPWMTELKTALRPSVRETAATALVNGRYASRPQVKAALAAAAMADPAAAVRAHCVRLLGRLGYSEPDYVTFLQSAAYSDAPDVQSAARLALTRLSPR